MTRCAPIICPSIRCIRTATNRICWPTQRSVRTLRWDSAAAMLPRYFPAAVSAFSTTDPFDFTGANVSMLAPFLLMTLTRPSPCKVNLLLNILGKRPDGFHELETVMHPVAVFDRLTFERTGRNLELSCSDSSLPTDSRNLVHRAATQFLATAKIKDGVRVHLE